MSLLSALPGRTGRTRLSPPVVGIVAALSLLSCGGGEDLCGGPFCVTPPGRQEATQVRARSGDGQVGAPGRELELPLEVVVTDDDNRPIPDVEVNFTIVGEVGGAISKPAIRSDHEGLAQVKWTLGAVPGVQTVHAVAVTSSGAALSGSPVTFSAEAVRPPPARILLLQAPPTLVQNGVLFDRQPIIGILDLDNEPVSDVAVTVSIASGAGTLHGTTTVPTDAEGRARYEDLTIRGPTGSRTLRFSLSEPVLEVVSPPLEVGAGTVTHMLGNEPLAYQGTVNSPVSPAPAVTVRDDVGNPAPGVAITFVADGDGSVSPATVITNEAGVAQVTSWTLGRSAGVQYTLTARIQSAGNAPVVFSATARAGTAGKLEIRVQPGPTAQSGVPFSRQPAVQVTDELGNPAPQPGLTILATLSSGPGGMLRQASARTNASGLATFSGLSLTGLVGNYILTFSEPTLTGVASNPISVSAGPPSRLALTVSPPPAARSRVPFETQPSIQLQDASGNPVAQAGVEVRASIASGDGTLAGQTSALTNDNGRADYTDLAIVGGPGERTLLFASASPASDVRSATITLPSVTGITLLTAPPTSVVVGSRLTTPASWTLTDAANQPVADAAVVISVSPGGSVEPVTASDPSGIVQLPSWTVSQVPGSQYVELEVPGVGVSRVTVEAVPDAAFRLQKTSGDSQSAPVNSTLLAPLVVQVLDQYGNGVSDVTVEWRTCDGIGGYNTLTDIGGHASAFQETGPTPGEFCAMASTAGLVDSPVRFTYTVTGTDPPSPTSSGQLRAKPPRAPSP
ncbi:MAG TPA: Ig-like domain-containing protein [Gemmatimonadales bacterium]|nr:Ig-like domain-containing protein [Gemmatimonadales bacterium]